VPYGFFERNPSLNAPGLPAPGAAGK